jgi:hypothetical protein
MMASWKQKTEARADRTDNERELEQNETGRTKIEGSTENREGKTADKNKILTRTSHS